MVGGVEGRTPDSLETNRAKWERIEEKNLERLHQLWVWIQNADAERDGLERTTDYFSFQEGVENKLLDSQTDSFL